MTNNQSSYFLKLSSQPIVFEPIVTGTSVFYDKDNQQLFCVRGSGAMEMSYEQEENTDSFRFTRRKKQNRRVILNSTLIDNQSLFNQEQLIKNLENKIQFIRTSYFWLEFQNYLHQWINRQLTSFDILSYGLGHISSSICSQYQYALLKLIEEIFKNKIENIYLYDPIWTKDEYDFLRNNNSYLKYEILTENNQAYQTIHRSSFIYIPFCSKPIHNNLLYSNWNKEKLKEILFFGNSLEKFSNEIQFDPKKFFYIYQSTSFATEISLPLFEHYTNAFNEQVFTSFDRTIIPLINEKKIIESKKEKNTNANPNKNILEKITIEQVLDDIWSILIKPIYSNEDEIVVSSHCVTVKGHRHEQAYSFRLEDKGAIQSIKFNPDLSVLAIKRNSNSVEFLNFAPIPQTSLSSRTTTSTAVTILQPDAIEYSQLSKTKSSKLHDFNWLSEKEIVFITEQSIEHYILNAEKRTLRPLKHHALQSANWQLFSREMSLLLISAGSPSGNTLFPFSFPKTQQQQLVKLPKFEVDLPQVTNQRSNSIVSTSSNSSTSRRCNELTERDCMLATVYGKSYLLIIRQVLRVPGQGSVEVVLYQIEDDHKPAQKRHILRLNLPGKCALSVIDNLILIHHQPTKATYIYDIAEKSSTSQDDGFQTIHDPLLSQLSIQPVTVNWQLISSSISPSPTAIELYSSNWIVFLPNVIIDVKMGCLWYLLINLDYLLDFIPDRLLLINILLRRANGKATILTLLRTLLTNVIAPVQIDSNNLSNLCSSNVSDLWIEMIDRINRVFVENSPNRPLLDQSDIYSVLSLFSTIVSIPPIGSNTTYNRSLTTVSAETIILDDNDQSKALKFAISILIEYIRSLNDCSIPVQYFIYELLVNLLVKNNQFFQLQQLIQYQVVTDSLQLACLLLSLSNKQQPTTQIALDMLKRLTSANEEIVEILLGHNYVIEALHFCIEHLPITRTLARKLIEAAIKSDELLSSTTSNQKILFFTVYTYFEEYFQRTTTTTGPSVTNNNEQKDELEMFKTLFNLHFRNQDNDVSNL